MKSIHGLKALAFNGLLLAFLLTAGGTSWGASPASASGDVNLSDLIAAAKKEGSVTLYNAVPNSSGKVARAFEKTYGIPVDVLEFPSGSLLQRFSSESQAKAPSADILIAASLERSAPDLAAKGWLEPIRSSNIPAIASGQFPSSFVGAYTATANFMPFVIAYNTDKIREDQAPKEFADLSNVKYKDQLLLIDPATSETHIQMWDRVRQASGDKALQAIAADNPRLYQSATAVAEALAAGEGSVGVTTPPGLSKVMAAGAPLAYTTPNVTTGSEMQIALVAQRPHPAAGRLMANFLLTPEGNKILSDGIIGVLDSKMPAPRLVSLRPDETAITRKDSILGLLGLKE